MSLYIFKLVFNDNQHCPSVTSVTFDSKTMISWRIFLEKVIDDFTNKRYEFNYKAKMNTMTKAK